MEWGEVDGDVICPLRNVVWEMRKRYGDDGLLEGMDPTTVYIRDGMVVGMTNGRNGEGEDMGAGASSSRGTVNGRVVGYGGDESAGVPSGPRAGDLVG